jgi:hypothetical protein
MAFLGSPRLELETNGGMASPFCVALHRRNRLSDVARASGHAAGNGRTNLCDAEDPGGREECESCQPISEVFVAADGLDERI